MNKPEPRYIVTGSDPRLFSDFTMLCDEMYKLAHSACPDVDWRKVESLSVSLFEKNGVDLQTAAWYTLARTHLARIDGMNEGLVILNNMLTNQWTKCWPLPSHVRADILSRLSQRLQKVCRRFTFTDDDLPALYETEKQLQSLNDILGRQDLKQICLLTPLQQQISNMQARLENGILPAVVLPPQGLIVADMDNAVQPIRGEHVTHPAPDGNVPVNHGEASVISKRWPAFLAGVLLTCLAGGSVLGIHHWLHRFDRITCDLSLSAVSLPGGLITEQLDAVRRSSVTQADTHRWLKRPPTQLKVSSDLPPDWSQQYGNQLLARTGSLWPENKHVMLLRHWWEQQLMMSAVPEMRLTGGQEGMMQLQTLDDKLNSVDGQKGNSSTASELKVTIFSAMNDFRSGVPAEALSRILAEPPQSAAEKQIEQKSIERHLLARYSHSTTRQSTQRD
jgi:type VI secretion system protein VasL